MHIIEFQAIVKNGVIKIPRKYPKHLTTRVRVILFAEESRKPTATFIDQLLANPERVQGFHPLTREQAHAR